MNIETLKATFLEESHNRFIAIINLNNENIECYVPSSAKMSNFVNLIGKEILVTKNKDTSRRTKYSLFAVKYYNKYILLNLNLVNTLLREYLFSISAEHEYLLEKSINGYKSDILMKPTEGDITLVEAKGIISTKRSCIFPSKNSKRALIQILELEELINMNNLNIHYYLINLGPITKKIQIQDSGSEYIRSLKSCLAKGMVLKAISIEYRNDIFYYKELPIEFL